MKTPYNHADKALKTLNDTISREFQNFSMTVGFDEINLMETKKSVTELYNRIDRAVRREYRKLAKKVWRDTEKEIGILPGVMAVGLLIAGLLKGYNGVTKYVYNNEWKRKRDRLVESLMASNGNQEMRQALQRALNLMADQVRQYADEVTDETRLAVFTVAGITEVIWVSQKDAKVCSTCAERDGKKYKIGNIPEKHHRCRCYLIPSK